LGSAWESFKDGFKPQYKRLGVAEAAPNKVKMGDSGKTAAQKNKASKAAWESMNKKSKSLYQD